MPDGLMTNYGLYGSRAGGLGRTSSQRAKKDDEAGSQAGRATGREPANTLTMESFFKLLAVQLQNQDMSNPMDNSEMMAQMTQMAMMQAIDNFSHVSITTYSASLVGKEVTLAGIDANGKPTDPITGRVTSVSLYGGQPLLYLDDKDVGYPVSRLMVVHADKAGTSPKPEGPDDPGDPDKPGDGDKPGDTGSSGAADQPGDADQPGEADKPGEEPG